MASAGARAYNGGLEVKLGPSPQGSKGRAPGQGKLKAFEHMGVKGSW